MPMAQRFACRLIRTLNPSPGRPFASRSAGPCGRRAARCAAALLCAASLAVLAGAGHAVPLSGSFTRDDDALQLALPLAGASSLHATTTGWAAGGFAPVLSLFNGGGLLLALDVGSSHACTDPGAGLPDPATGFCWDARLGLVLAAGNYTLVLTQDGNLPVGPTLADGYGQTGNPDYTGLAYLGQPGLRFINVDGRQRTADYRLEIAVQPLLAVPEPAAPLLLALGLGVLVLQRQHQRRRVAAAAPLHHAPGAAWPGAASSRDDSFPTPHPMPRKGDHP